MIQATALQNAGSLMGNIWFTLALWTVLYFGDYYLTLYTARGFRSELGEHLEFERSFELNPTFEEDINQLRRISPRFLGLWLLICLLLWLAGWLAGLLVLPGLLTFITGQLILLELAIHLRHLRNLALLKTYRYGALTGRLRYAYWFGLSLSAWEMFGFAALYLILAVLENSWFFAGGALGSLMLGIKHRRRSKLSLEEKR